MKQVLGLLGVFATAIVISLTVVDYSQSPIDVHLSPDGHYRIELFGHKGPRNFPIGSNSVHAHVYSGDRFIGTTSIHTNDFMDTSFEMTYQQFRWSSESVFGLHGVADHDVATNTNGDSLTITNGSSKRINFLNITFGVNKFIALELEPGGSRRVHINHSMAPTWIAGDGAFVDGQSINWHGMNFFEDAKRGKERLFRYCFTVKDSGLKIDSLDVVGENSSPRVVTPTVTTCGE